MSLTATLERSRADSGGPPRLSRSFRADAQIGDAHEGVDGTGRSLAWSAPPTSAN